MERVLEAEMFWEKDQATRLSNVLLSSTTRPSCAAPRCSCSRRSPQNDMFMFLPELGKTRRITTQMVQGNMMGTDFSYEDFQRLQGMITSLDARAACPTRQVAERKPSS